jgi:hypothetical protein
LVERSESLARGLRPQQRELTPFEQLVADAIDRLPAEFAEVIDHVPVVVSDRGAEIHGYGEYYGATVARDRAAHRIVIFQDTLERDFGSDRICSHARSTGPSATRSPITSATASPGLPRSGFDA